MILIDNVKNKKINDILLLLKKDEAIELRDALADLLNSEVGKSHSHVSNDRFDKEISVVLYNPDDNPKNYNLHEKLIPIIEKKGKIQD